MIQALLDYYRIPVDSLSGLSATNICAPGDVGFFQFGPRNICYGRCHSGTTPSVADSGKFDASKEIRREGTTILIPFDFTEVIENLRLERYRQKMTQGLEMFAASEPVRKLYYLAREVLPVSVRRQLQKAYFRDWRQLPFPAWPVDFTVDDLHQEFLRLCMETSGVKKMPFIWFWPGGAPNCLILTHDVETSAGRDFTFKLVDLDESYGFRASFQVIPEKRYEVPDEYVSQIRSRGCEFNIHDLNHDGQLFQEREEFVRRAARINAYVHRYNSQGFRAGAMYRNQEWYDAFDFSYDMSVPNVAHLEPMRGGCCTVMPYFIGKIVELPLTAAQDYSLFHIFKDYSIDLWKQQLALLRERNGLMSFIAHPDYLIERRARNVYESLLEYLRQMVAREKIWAVLPRDVDHWWRARSQMSIVSRGGEWEIVGPEKERARLAYAILDAGQLRYELA
ncbi:MAG: hypothetical protein ABSD89_07405 [Halobacteriota archaeon]